MSSRMSPSNQASARNAELKKFKKRSVGRKLRTLRNTLQGNAKIPERIPAKPGLLTGKEAVIAPYPPPQKTELTPSAKRKRKLV